MHPQYYVVRDQWMNMSTNLGLIGSTVMPGVVSVFQSRAHQLHTTRSWEFLGLQHPSGAVSQDSLWTKAQYGEDVIIGVLDTGKQQHFLWMSPCSYKYMQRMSYPHVM